MTDRNPWIAIASGPCSNKVTRYGERGFLFRLQQSRYVCRLPSPFAAPAAVAEAPPDNKPVFTMTVTDDLLTNINRQQNNELDEIP
jgi:hypothetical protein